jgi:DNA mismatch endonuclease (patch repair protein)
MPRRTVDVAFTKQRIACFIDGCFWHSCPEHFVPPQTHPEFWRRKFEQNRTRDLETNTLLAEHGWTALRFWEHEDPKIVAHNIREAVRAG